MDNIEKVLKIETVDFKHVEETINNTLLYVEPIYQTIVNESNVPSLKKVIVASGTKMAIGDNLKEALANLLSQEALNIEINRADNIEDLIQSIIKSNKNLSESSKSNNWELVGSDLKELQTLINSLEKMMEEEKDKKENDELEGITSEVQSLDKNLPISE